MALKRRSTFRLSSCISCIDGFYSIQLGLFVSLPGEGLLLGRLKTTKTVSVVEAYSMDRWQHTTWGSTSFVLYNRRFFDTSKTAENPLNWLKIHGNKPKMSEKRSKNPDLHYKGYQDLFAMETSNRLTQQLILLPDLNVLISLEKNNAIRNLEKLGLDGVNLELTVSLLLIPWYRLFHHRDQRCTKSKNNLQQCNGFISRIL